MFILLICTILNLNFKLMLFLPFILFMNMKNHFVLSLLILEIMSMNLIYLFIVSLNHFELTFFYLLLVFLVGEAVLGLTLLVSTSQKKTGELMNLSVF